MLELIKSWFFKSQQTFIQCCQERIQQSPLQFSALFDLRLLWVDLMTFQTIDEIVQTSLESDFRLITTLKITAVKFT